MTKKKNKQEVPLYSKIILPIVLAILIPICVVLYKNGAQIHMPVSQSEKPSLPGTKCSEWEIEVEGECVESIKLESSLYQREPYNEIRSNTFDEEDFFGYISIPQGEKSDLGILLLTDSLEVPDYKKKITDLFAGEGYVSFLVSYKEQYNVIALRESISNLKENHDINKIVIIGWGKSGENAILYSTETDVEGVVSYYGKVSEELELIQKISGPVLAVFSALAPLQEEEDLKKIYDTMLEEEKSAFFQFYNSKNDFMDNTSEGYDNISTIDTYELTLSFIRGLIEEK